MLFVGILNVGCVINRTMKGYPVPVGRCRYAFHHVLLFLVTSSSRSWELCACGVAQVALRANPDTFALQNDGDEMLVASAALHLKVCFFTPLPSLQACDK